MTGYVNYQLAVDEQPSSVVDLYDVGVARTVEFFLNEKQRQKKREKDGFYGKRSRIVYICY